MEILRRRSAATPSTTPSGRSTVHYRSVSTGTLRRRRSASTRCVRSSSSRPTYSTTLPTIPSTCTLAATSCGASTTTPKSSRSSHHLLEILSIIYLQYITILRKSVCRGAQSTGRSSCSIVSGDISNCSYRLSFLSLMRSHLSSAQEMLFRRKIQKTSTKTECWVDNRVAPYDHLHGLCGVYIYIDCELHGWYYKKSSDF